jgi:hypothetical protein
MEHLKLYRVGRGRHAVPRHHYVKEIVLIAFDDVFVTAYKAFRGRLSRRGPPGRLCRRGHNPRAGNEVGIGVPKESGAWLDQFRHAADDCDPLDHGDTTCSRKVRGRRRRRPRIGGRPHLGAPPGACPVCPKSHSGVGRVTCP